MSTTTLVTTLAVALALIGLALLAASRRNRHTRPMSFRESRRARPKEGTVGTAEDYACTTALQKLVDGMTLRWCRARGRSDALESSLAHRQARAEQTEKNLDRAEARLKSADDAAEGQRPPAVWGRFFLMALYIGDLTVITMALQAESGGSTSGIALLAALSLGTALLIFGKMGGHLAKDQMDETRGLVVSRILLGLAAVLVIFGISLMLLRVGSIWAWLVLSIAPALGSAAVTILGPTVEQREVARRSRQLPRFQKRLVRAQRAVDRVNQSKSRIDGESEARIRRFALLAESEMKRLGVPPSAGSHYVSGALQNCDSWVAAIHGNPVTADTDQPIDTPPVTAETDEPVLDGHYLYEETGSDNGSETVGAARSSY